MEDRYLKLSGLEPLIATPELNFINIGERTNVTGSRAFLNHIKANDFESALNVAKEQVQGGAQIMDINMAKLQFSVIINYIIRYILYFN